MAEFVIRRGDCRTDPASAPGGRVVVLGAAGLLGLDVVRAFTSGGWDVVGATRQMADITQFDQVRALLGAVKPNLVVNVAAFTRVDECESNRDQAYAVNALGARNVAVAAFSARAELVHLSTDYVFDGSRPGPYDEFDFTGPVNVYGRSKLAGEGYVRAICPRHFIVRTQWLYGRGGRNFVATIRTLAQESLPDEPGLKVVADQTGSPTYTADLARALVLLVERPRYGTYHLTNSGSCTWWELACRIVELTGATAKVVPVSTAEAGRPARRPPFSVLDNLCWRLEGLPPLRPYGEALSEFLAEVTDRPNPALR